MHPLSTFTGRALSLWLTFILIPAPAPAQTPDDSTDLKALVTVEARRRALTV